MVFCGLLFSLFAQLALAQGEPSGQPQVPPAQAQAGQPVQPQGLAQIPTAQPAMHRTFPQEFTLGEKPTQQEANLQKSGTGQGIWTSQEVADSALTPVNLTQNSPNIIIQGTEAGGVTPTISLRGSPSDEVLVLWNGLELNDPSTSGGGANPFDFQREFSHKMSLLLGPQSLLWGPQAQAGVIQWDRVFDPHTRLQAGAGTLQSQRALIETQNGFQTSGWGHGQWGVGGSHFRSQGLSVSSDPSIDEKDRYRRDTGSAFVNWTVNPETQVEFIGSVLDSAQDDDLSGQQDLDARSSRQQKAGKIKIQQNLSEKDQVQLEYQSVSSQREDRNDPLSTGYLDRSDGERTKQELKWLHQRDLFHFTFLWDSRMESMSGSGEGATPTSPWNQRQSAKGLSVFFDQCKLSQLNSEIEFGARWDQYQPFADTNKNYWSWSGLYRWTQVPFLSPYLKTSEGHRFPTLYQRYSLYGDSRLSSQTLRAYEIGADGFVMENLRWSLAVFRNDYKDLIDYDLSSSKYQNKGQVRTIGFDVGLGRDLVGFSWRWGLSYLEAQDLLKKEDLLRRPRWSQSFYVNSQWNDFWSLAGSFKWSAERVDSTSQGRILLTQRYDSAVSVTYRSLQGWKLSSLMQNILASYSPDAQGYTRAPPSAELWFEINF